MNLNELITKADLIQFEEKVLTKIEQLLSAASGAPMKKWLRSKDVEAMLSISSSSLQNMRNSGAIPYTKLEGTILYPYEEILNILQGK